jgi:hypothetical protein
MWCTCIKCIAESVFIQYSQRKPNTIILVDHINRCLAVWYVLLSSKEPARVTTGAYQASETYNGGFKFYLLSEKFLSFKKDLARCRIWLSGSVSSFTSLFKSAYTPVELIRITF